MCSIFLCMPEAVSLLILLDRFGYACFLKVLLCKKNNRSRWLLFCYIFHHDLEISPNHVAAHFCRWDIGWRICFFKKSLHPEISQVRKVIVGKAYRTVLWLSLGKKCQGKCWLMNFSQWIMRLIIKTYQSAAPSNLVN